MNNNDCYEEYNLEIAEEVFSKDYDEVGFDPTTIDDSDSDAAELFGYNNGFK